MSGQHFDRNCAVQACVAGLVDFAHATRADSGEDFIRAELCARRERHVLGFQFRITVIGAAAWSSLVVFIRNRSPSGETAYCCMLGIWGAPLTTRVGKRAVGASALTEVAVNVIFT